MSDDDAHDVDTALGRVELTRSTARHQKPSCGAMHTPAGLIAFEPRPNLVVARALDLIAGLLRCQRGLGGIPYWAVGSGDPAWDANAPPPDRRACALHHEIFRKRIDPDKSATMARPRLLACG